MKPTSATSPTSPAPKADDRTKILWKQGDIIHLVTQLAAGQCVAGTSPYHALHEAKKQVDDFLGIECEHYGVRPTRSEDRPSAVRPDGIGGPRSAEIPRPYRYDS